MGNFFKNRRGREKSRRMTEGELLPHRTEISYTGADFYTAASGEQPQLSEEEANPLAVLLPADSIAPNQYQPRRKFDDNSLISLADSIRQHGILQPLTVRVLPARCGILPASGENPIYELIAGERRLRAAKLLGMEQVPCILVDVSDSESAELAIIENIQREDLNMFEQAAAIASLIELHDLTQEQIARRLSASQSYVANKLRLLRYSAKERELIIEESLTERHARAALRVKDCEKRMEVLRTVAARGMNVSRTEEYIDKLLADEEEAAQNERRRIVIKDIRLFYNTVEHAMETMRSAGVEVTSRKIDRGDCTEFSIFIPNKK